MNLSKHSLKRSFVYGVVGSLVASALMGILVIIQGSFDEIDWKILGTTLIVGLFSITSLASLRTLESNNASERDFSRLSVLASVAAFAVVTFLIWTNQYFDAQDLWKLAWVLTVLAISSAHACLLLPLLDRSKNLQAVTLSTLTFIAVVAALLIYLVVRNWDEEVGTAFYRILGVFAILDVLGTIIAPIMGKFLTPAVAAAVQPAPSSDSVSSNTTE